MSNINNQEDTIKSLPTDKTEVNPKTLNLVNSLFNNNEENKTLIYKKLIAICIVFFVFNVPIIEKMINKLSNNISPYIVATLKTLLFTIIVYCILTYVK